MIESSQSLLKPEIFLQSLHDIDRLYFIGVHAYTLRVIYLVAGLVVWIIVYGGC